MNLWALATNAGVNISLAALFLALYSVFSKQPSNAGVYFSRHVLRDRRGPRKEHATLESFIPSVGWIVRAWRATEDQVLESSGLDSLVLLRIFTFSIRLFALCTIVGILVLVPVTYTDSHKDKEEIPYDSFDRFTISNVKSGSKRLWFHFGVLYFISFSAYILLYLEYKNISQKRIEYLMKCRPQPDQFSVLVRSVPKSDDGKSYSDSVAEFFTQYYPSTYLSHNLIYSGAKVISLQHRLQKEINKLEILQRKPLKERKPQREGFLGFFGAKVDPIELQKRKLEDIYQNIRSRQHDLVHEKQELPAAVVSFKSRWGAAVAAQTLQADNPMTWVTEWAPEPRDIYWPNLSVPYSQMWIRSLVVGVLVFLGTILYVVPNVFVQAISELSNLEKWIPFLEYLEKIPGVESILTGYLSTVLLALLIYLVPPILLFLARLEGISSRSNQEKRASECFFYFLAGPVFFVNVLSASIIGELEFLKNPSEIPFQLGSAIPGKATFFMSYIMTTGWAGFPLEILQLSLLILSFLKRHTVQKGQDKAGLEVLSLPFYRTIPNVLLFILVGLTYAVIAPLLLPFLLVYFILGFIVFKNQILNVYEPAYETGGQYWPHVHNRIIVALFIMQLTFVGVFELKKFTIASLLTLPLIILTLVFNMYCNKRFFRIFGNFSMENTIKKDTDDEQRGLKDEILSLVEQAYLHPALQPVNIPENENSHLDHLLPSGSGLP